MAKTEFEVPQHSIFPRRKKNALELMEAATRQFQDSALMVDLANSEEGRFLHQTLAKLIVATQREILKYSNRPLKHQEILIELTATRKAYISILRVVALRENAHKHAAELIQELEGQLTEDEIAGLEAASAKVARQP